jgi:hypothetical protein
VYLFAEPIPGANVGGDVAVLQRFAVRLDRAQQLALENVARRVSVIENRQVTWQELLRKGAAMVLQAEGARPLPPTQTLTPANPSERK